MPRRVTRRKLDSDVVEKQEEQVERKEHEPDKQEETGRPKRGKKRRSDVGVNDVDEPVSRNEFTKRPNEKKTSKKENKEHHSETDENSANDFLDECKKLFNTSCLYEVLNVRCDASSTDIRKAYYKTALKYHPDKHQNSDDQQDMASKFKVICQAYQILSDTLYDENGSLTTCELATQPSDLMFIFKQVTTDEIEGFLQGYRNSEEERTDLLTCYKQCKGDWDEISGKHISYSLEQEERLKSIIQEAIEKKEIEDYGLEPAKRMKARHRKLVKEQNMAEKQSEAVAVKDLVQSIREKQERRAKDLSVKLNDIVKASGCKRAVKARKVTDGTREENDANVVKTSGCRSRRAVKSGKEGNCENEENVVKASGCRSRRAATKLGKVVDCENEEMHAETAAAPANKRAKRGKQG